jgi:Ca-activated chloride channel family protein
MLGFAHPDRLWLLLVLVPLALLFGWAAWRRARAWARFGESPLLGLLQPARPVARRVLRFALALGALACLVLALANLRAGASRERVERKGADVIIAFDLSASMLAEDLQPNRLERARFFAAKLLRELVGDKVGLIVFAGNAYLQMPMTVDASAAQMYLNVLDPGVIPRQGTAIGEAIAQGMAAFDAGEGQGAGKKANRAIIVITDGENHEGQALEKAKEAAEAGIRIFTVGVGTPKGAPIPVRERFAREDFKRDGDGNIVLSKLNEDVLREIAAAGGGTYVHVAGGNQAIRDLSDAVAELAQATGETYEFTDYRQHFPVFLGLAFALLLLEFLLPDRASGFWRRLFRFDA